MTATLTSADSSGYTSTDESVWDNTPVIKLTQANFKSRVLDTNHLTVVDFYGKSCIYSNLYQSHVIITARKLAGIARVAAIDCEDEENKGVCEEYGIELTPTVKLFGPGIGDDKEDNNNNNNTNTNAQQVNHPVQVIETFKGIVYSDKMTATVLKKVSDLEPITMISSPSQAHDFAQATEKTRIVLLSGKGRLPPALYRSLAIDFKSPQVVFAYSTPDLVNSLVQRLNIDKSSLISNSNSKSKRNGNSSILVLPSNGLKPHLYKNALKRGPMVKFLSKFALQTDPLQGTRRKPPAVVPGSISGINSNSDSNNGNGTIEKASRAGITTTTLAWNTDTVITPLSGAPKLQIDRVYSFQELHAKCFSPLSSSRPCLIASIGARHLLDAMRMLTNARKAASAAVQDSVQMVYFVDMNAKDDIQTMAQWLGLAPYPRSYVPDTEEPRIWYHPTTVVYVNAKEGWQVGLRERFAGVSPVQELMDASWSGTNVDRRVPISMDFFAKFGEMEEELNEHMNKRKKQEHDEL